MQENYIKSNKVLLRRRQKDIIRIKQLIWLYFYLLIFEGALRKWVLPGMSNLLLIIRDPVALYILFLAFRNGWLRNNYIVSMVVVSGIGFFSALLFGHGNPVVALYGLRITLIHFPLIFIIGRVFNKQDVLRVGTVLLWLSLPMMILNAFQFYTPQSSWFNRGVGGDMAGAGFGGALGYFRPPGTFSFTNGNVLFWNLTGAYVFYGWLSRERFNRNLLIVASVALFGAVAFSISRTLVFQLGLTGIFVLFALARKPGYFSRVVVGIVAVALAAFVLSNLPVFHTGLHAFEVRFEQATTSEGHGSVSKNIIDRMILGGMVNALTQSTELPFWGYGLGMGTNAGAKILTGKTLFLISEGEWGRLLGECGLLLGLAMILIRVALSFKMLRNSYVAMTRGNVLPWILLSVGLVNILQGPWAQPTSLGFAIFIGGLVLASGQSVKRLKSKKELKKIGSK